eukprot:Skav204496  [mRNA]  locus=scaffold1457:91869:106236:- [translate_table: standard]
MVNSVLTVYRGWQSQLGADHQHHPDAEDGSAIAAVLAKEFGLVFVLGYVVSYLFVVMGIFNVILAVYVDITMKAAKENDAVTAEQYVPLAPTSARESIRVARATRELASISTQVEEHHDHLSSHLEIKETAELFTDDEIHENIEISKELFLLVVQDRGAQFLMDELDLPANRAQLFDVIDADGSGSLHIQELVQGLLKIRGEVPLLEILRRCCGEVQDLAEIAGGVKLGLQGGIPTGSDPAPASGSKKEKEPSKEAKHKEKKKESKQKKESKRKGGDKDPESPKEKKESRRRERTPSEERAYRGSGIKEEEEERGEEDTPLSVAPVPLGSQDHYEEDEEEEPRERDSPSRSPVRRRDPEETQRFVDEFAAANPRGYGLKAGPRGSVGRHFERSGRDQPPEPDHPPRREDRAAEESPSPREPLERRRSKGKGKGESSSSSCSSTTGHSSPCSKRTRSSRWRTQQVDHRREVEERRCAEQLPVASSGVRVASEAASYYGAPCKVSGEVTHCEMTGADVKVHVKALGTTSDGLLTWASAQSSPKVRLHLCPNGCNQEEVADNLVHVNHLRLMGEVQAEDGWASNLLPVEVGRDDLQALRQRGEALATPAVKEKAKDKDKKEKADSEGSREKKKRKKKSKSKEKKKDDKAEKSKKSKKKKEDESSSSSSGEKRLDGRRCKAASKKEPRVLFEGTGLDSKERVRKVVARKARRYLRKKGRSSSSKSGSSGSADDLEEMDFNEDSIFAQSSKVRLVAEKFPGALASQTLGAMRTHLLSEVGTESSTGGLQGVVLPYYRQCLQKKGSGPQQREMLTLASGVEALLCGRVAQAADLMLQRLKSCEQTLAGTHWSVSQRLELLSPEGITVTPVQELQSAQKEAYTDNKTRLQSSYQDGRAPAGKGKHKNDSKDKGYGKGRKGSGKGPSGKNDGSKKEDSGAKS